MISQNLLFHPSDELKVSIAVSPDHIAAESRQTLDV